MKRSIISSIVTVLIVFLISGCDSNKVPVGNKPVILQLNWTPDPTFAGAYIAADSSRNYFAQEGLNVSIQAGGFGIDHIAPVVAKKALFAVAGADKAAIAYANGAPIRVVAVEFQRNPVGWIVRRSRNITKISDIVGKNDIILGDKVGTETTSILELMLRRTGLKDKLEPKPVGFDFAYFLQTENVVYPVYLNEEPVTARKKGIDILEIDPSKPENGGVHLYGNVIIVHKDTVKEDPKVIRAFIDGLRKGWEYARSHVLEAEAILRRYQEFDTEQMPEVLSRSVEFATSSYGVDVSPGHMEVAQWESTLRVLRESGLLNRDLKVSDLVWFGGSN